MDEEKIVVYPERVGFAVRKEYKKDIMQHFRNLPEVAAPLIKEAKATFKEIEQSLYTAPAFIKVVKSVFPETTLQALLTNEQKKQIANGALKLMAKKDGSLMANLIDPSSKKIVGAIPLKEVKGTPELSQSMMNLSVQLQMAQIAEHIQEIQTAIEEVRIGLEYDRLATAYSCQQKLYQAMEIKNPELRSLALLQLASDAEDSRNLLMLSQKNNVEYIHNQPEKLFGKVLSGASHEKINARMNEIRQSLYAVNMVSFTEAMAYTELGEYGAANRSLSHYAKFIEDTYTSVPGLLQRLDLIDPSTERYWTKTLPVISEDIKKLPGVMVMRLSESTKNKEE